MVFSEGKTGYNPSARPFLLLLSGYTPYRSIKRSERSPLISRGFQ
ncbi:hypothetical protein CHCC15381_0401 [Bacillus paralicheniformis]|uniref:Uncharacterized protein n=1 Tax=Bacillus paralicheniformis TaxID=1648923 RepID=A0ABY3FYW1_9BACI|nr:hypothetical protein CHCC15381_0401 [Bacillus paralicheniformis]